MSERAERNQVFQSGQASQVLDQYSDIPVESVPLPSLGLVYPVGSSLHGAETVEIRAMTAKEEDILSSRALIKKGTVISHLLQSCIVDRSVDARSLLGGDRNAIMIAIRVTGYGPQYDIEVQCSACRHKDKYSYDLGALPIKRLEIAPAEPGTNAFDVKLPVTGRVIRFKFLTGIDEENIVATQEKMKKLIAGGIDNLITTKLKTCIVSIDGNTDRLAIDKFVNFLPARDSLFLRKYIDNNEPGVEMKVAFACSNADCGHTEEVALPLGPSFFWPDA